MVALVTGGGSGIGQETAVALAVAGAEVVVAGRRADALERTAAKQNSMRPVPGDVVSGAARIVEAAVAMAGRLDVLVNNAGAVRPTPLGQTEFEIAEALWRTNVLGPTLLVEFALPHLEQTRGAIVNVSSTFGHKPAPTISQYGASKAALEHLTRSWALELAERGIRVNAVAPGPTESEALERGANGGRHRGSQRGRTPKDPAPTPRRARGRRWIVALADAAATWITGEVIGVDGGFGLV